MLSSSMVVLGFLLQIVEEEVQTARALVDVALLLVLQNKEFVVHG